MWLYLLNKQKNQKCFRLIALVFAIFFIFTTIIHSQNYIRAKIAIMLVEGDTSKNLKSNDRVNAGDSIWIFVQPFSKVFVYAIYSDDKVAVLLTNKDSSQGSKSQLLEVGIKLILPSRNHLYVFDAKSPFAKFTIFCGASIITEVEKLFNKNNTVRADLWYSTEKNVIDQYKTEITGIQDKPFSIGGNVRGNIEEFLSQQPVFEGKEIIIRIFNIEIKK
jgi:hypothetical protein